MALHPAAQQLTSLTGWRAPPLPPTHSASRRGRCASGWRSGVCSTTCQAQRRDVLLAAGGLLGDVLCSPLQGWAAGEDVSLPLTGLQQAGEVPGLPDYTKPGPFVPMRLPRLEHTASSAFPACMGNQCLLRVTVFYPKAAGSGATPPYPLCIFSGGFMVPASKYLSYAERLASWGYVALLYDKVEVSSLEVKFLSDVVSVAFLRDLISWTASDAVLSQLTSPEQGVLLCGHSRGGKVSVLTAEQDERVTALCLLDPVDNTKYAPLGVDFPSAVEALKRLGMQDRPLRPAVPMAVIGGALSADCAPRDANYRLFYDATAAPAWQMVLPDTGHFQWLDEQSTLDRAVCTAGRTPDASVRAFSQAAMVAWAEIMLRQRERAPAERQWLLQAANLQLRDMLPGVSIDLDQKNLAVL